MAQPYIGQVLTFGGNFAPQGYLACNGQSVPISQYETLFQLIGTTYGGDGVQTFNVPDLRGRTPVHMGRGAGTGTYVIGQVGGTESVTLNTQQLPNHPHAAAVITGAPSTSATPASNEVLGDMGPSATTTTHTYQPFTAGAQTALAGQSISATGGGQSHENRQPFLVFTYAIATIGVFPSQQ
jgi:microcystin-dependent protein